MHATEIATSPPSPSEVVIALLAIALLLPPVLLRLLYDRRVRALARRRPA